MDEEKWCHQCDHYYTYLGDEPCKSCDEETKPNWVHTPKEDENMNEKAPINTDAYSKLFKWWESYSILLQSVQVSGMSCMAASADKALEDYEAKAKELGIEL